MNFIIIKFIIYTFLINILKILFFTSFTKLTFYNFNFI